MGAARIENARDSGEHHEQAERAADEHVGIDGIALPVVVPGFPMTGVLRRSAPVRNRP